MHGILNHRLGYGFSQVGVLALNSSHSKEGSFELVLLVSCRPLWQFWPDVLISDLYTHLCLSGPLFKDFMISAQRSKISRQIEQFFIETEYNLALSVSCLTIVAISDRWSATALGYLQ